MAPWQEAGNASLTMSAGNEDYLSPKLLLPRLPTAAPQKVHALGKYLGDKFRGGGFPSASSTGLNTIDVDPSRPKRHRHSNTNLFTQVSNWRQGTSISFDETYGARVSPSSTLANNSFTSSQCTSDLVTEYSDRRLHPPVLKASRLDTLTSPVNTPEDFDWGGPPIKEVIEPLDYIQLASWHSVVPHDLPQQSVAAKSRSRIRDRKVLVTTTFSGKHWERPPQAHGHDAGRWACLSSAAYPRSGSVQARIGRRSSRIQSSSNPG